MTAERRRSTIPDSGRPTWWTRGRAFLRTVMDLFPFTAGGLVLLVLCGLAFVRYGWVQQDLVLLVIGGVGFAVALLSVVAVMIASLVVVWTVRGRFGPPLEVECGYAVRTGFRLTNLWFLPFATVEWTWDDPEVVLKRIRGWTAIEEQITAARRGEYDRIVRYFEVGDVFGIAKMRFRLVEGRRLRFVPSSGGLKNIQAVHGMAGGDAFSHPEGPPVGDKFDMRYYAAGDPIRFVLWKVYARTRELVIRTPERALSPVRQTVAYLVAARGDEPAAGAARAAVASGLLGADWVLGTDGAERGAKTMGDAVELLVRSASSPLEAGGSGLQSFLANAVPGGTKRALVFVPAKDGPWLDRVLAACHGGVHAPMEFIVCTDGVSPPKKQTFVRRFLFAEAEPPPSPNPPADPKELATVLQKLGRSGARVVVVDRSNGRVIPDVILHRVTGG